MSRRDVTIYTCDGCRASSTVDRDEPARGFSQIALGTGDTYWLCAVCDGAVDWVVRFQRITQPPKVYQNRGVYGLRKPN